MLKVRHTESQVSQCLYTALMRKTNDWESRRKFCHCTMSVPQLRLAAVIPA